MSESPKPICCEEKLVVVFHHPQKTNRWKSLIVGPSIALFPSLKREKKKGSFLHRMVVVATFLEKMVGHNKTPNNTEEPARNDEKVPAEIVLMLETTAGAIDKDDEDLVRNILPGMVDDGNQPLLENIPTAGEANEGKNMWFFSDWEHSGSCYCCLEGGCKKKARIHFNTNVKPTIQQLFGIFSHHWLLEQSSHR